MPIYGRKCAETDTTQSTRAQRRLYLHKDNDFMKSISCFNPKNVKGAIILLFLPMILRGYTIIRLSAGRFRNSRRQRKCQQCRLWMVNHYAVPPDMPGGTRHVELGTLLQHHGWTTTVFATPFNHVTGSFVRPVTFFQMASENVGPVRFCWLYAIPYRQNNWRRYANMLSFMVTFTMHALREPKPDVVVGSSPHPFAALASWLAAKRFQVPFVLEIRDVWPDTLVELGLDSRIIILPLTWIERFLYSRATRIIALTEGIQNRIIAKGITPGKISLIPNAAMKPLPIDPLQREIVRSKYSWGSRIVATWVGSHGPANGLNVIVEAAHKLIAFPEILFVLVGDGPTKAQLIQQAEGLSNISFLDPLPKNEVGDFLRAADIALLVHRQVNIVAGARPNKLFDYMSAALPIVSNIPGEAWSFIEQAGAGYYVPAEDGQALANAVRTLANDPKRRIMGANGLLHVQHNHSREQTAADLAQILADLLQDNR